MKRKILVLIALALLLSSCAPSEAEAATECQARPGDGHPWAWRQVAGKRCYYKGRRGKDKTLLAWPLAAPPRIAPPPPAAPLAPPLPLPPPPPRIALAAAASAPAPPAMAPVAAPRVVEVPVRIVGQALPPPDRPAVKAAPPPAPSSSSPWGIGALIVLAITAGLAFAVTRRRLRRLELGS